MAERISILTTVLCAACKRTDAEVGRLVKACLAYVQQGKQTDFKDPRLETFFDILVEDFNLQRTASEKKSRINSENAKCRTGSNGSASGNRTKKATANKSAKEDNEPQTLFDEDDGSADGEEADANAERTADAATDTTALTSATDAFNATDDKESFAMLRDLYGKTGDNESQAFDAWKQLSTDERDAAFTCCQRIVANGGYRDYLYVFLRDKKWSMPPPL